MDYLSLHYGLWVFLYVLKILIYSPFLIVIYFLCVYCICLPIERRKTLIILLSLTTKLSWLLSTSCFDLCLSSNCFVLKKIGGECLTTWSQKMQDCGSRKGLHVNQNQQVLTFPWTPDWQIKCWWLDFTNAFYFHQKLFCIFKRLQSSWS